MQLILSLAGPGWADGHTLVRIDFNVAGSCWSFIVSAYQSHQAVNHFELIVLSISPPLKVNDVYEILILNLNSNHNGSPTEV